MSARFRLRAAISGLLALGVAQCALAEAGAQLYAQHCSACHQPAGAGAPGLAPPLVGDVARLSATDAGRHYLAQVLVSGVSGRVSYHGPPYVGSMPSFKSLKDEELARLMAYVLAELNRDALPAGYTPMPAEDFAAARTRAMAARDIKQARQAALERK